MGITEAVKQAQKGKRIKRKNSPFPSWIEANGNGLVLKIMINDEVRTKPRWSPNIDDLLADDWITV